ncbi:glycosyltransferase family 90 protein [Parathielavia appendiculata]|uniref:Glycosyltransferase family 90 protein n=1 Tax=Parathielavia appendiculata TaxID=2587402 RepID=A0AAN6Z1U0_9PEZI|nr:glycosyltransferase family 90 protein [Parathielavia appendiculata]
MRSPHRPSTFRRFIVAALLLTLTIELLPESITRAFWVGHLTGATSWGRKHDINKHPIDAQIQTAENESAAKLSKSTRTLAAAAAAYRKRRGRHPPPGFDKWYEFATERDAIIVEDFWDQIYQDLEPFWGVQPAKIRKDARDFDMRIQIRNGKASTSSDWFWTQIWLDMIQTIEHLLPDMDLALNPMDEPRVMVPWEEIDVHMKKAAKTRRIVDVESVVSSFSTLPLSEEAPQDHSDIPPVQWEHDKHYWLIARRGCPPNSPARQAQVITDFDKPPYIASPFSLSLTHMEDGYVANYTLSTDFCHQPDLQALEGFFVEPISVSATKSLIPVFGGSKLSRNNDILLPAPIYWSEEERFFGAEGASIPWASKHKHPSAIWRGVATGGRNRETNWRAFQRHRFVAMNNATILAAQEAKPPPPNFALPDRRYALPTDDLAGWIADATDVAFTELACSHEGFSPSCNYTALYFSPAQGVPMAAQFQHKYLPDIDGNSFSGRYLGFLRSTSVPVKATLFREWHDARLVAWKHFVPMDTRFGDWWGILGYFLGGEGRDRIGEGIALAGREWAGRVLRKEDMAIYVLRLLLEYGRVIDERREVLGWVGDLR